MSKLTSRIFALAAGLAVAGGICSCGGIPGDAVVQVGGKSITKTTFNHWMQVASASTAASGGKPVIPDPPSYSACIAHLAATAPKPAKGQKAPTTAQLKTQCETQFKTLKTEVLGFLISSEWVIGEASTLGVKLTDAEVHKQFLKIKNQQFPKAAEFEKFLATSGQTVSDLLLRIKAVSLLPQKIEAKIVKDKGKVTTAQAQAYFNSHRPPEKRNVEIILTKTEAQAKSAKKEIESAKSFASVAKKVSIDPTSKANGGLLKEVTRGEEEKALDTAIFSTKPNVLSGPVETPFGYYVFEVTKTFAAKTFAQEESQIKQQLASTGQQTALSGFVTKFRKKWEAKTECAAEYMVADCKGYKAPKTTSTAAPTTSTPKTTTTPATTTKAPKKTPKTSTGAKKK